jgi:hypothetical protein
MAATRNKKMFESTATGKNGWLTAILIFVVPILFIFFLGSQMAYSQVKSKFEPYQNIPEVSSLSELESISAGQVVMLRGQISEPAPQRDVDEFASDLIIFQVRPVDGREVRFQEEFPLVVPEFMMALPDGTITIRPSSTRERVIYDELHRISDGEYERTGFKIGDMVTVQGQWQPSVTNAGATPALLDMTGVTGGDKASLIATWHSAFQKVSWVRNILGLLAILGLIWLIVQLRRTQCNNFQEENETWQNQTTKTVPTT